MILFKKKFITISIAGLLLILVPTVAHAATMMFKTGTANPDVAGSATVTFGSSMPSANYSTLISGGGDTDSMYSMAYLNKLVGSFSIKAEDDTGVAEQNTGTQWMAFQHGEYDFSGNFIKCAVGGGAAGNNTVSFTTAFPNTNYSIISSATDDTDSPTVNFTSGSKQVGQVTIRIEDDDGTTEAVTATNHCAFSHGEYTVGTANIKAGSAVTAGSGDTTVSFTTSFSSTNYVVVAMAQAVSGALCSPEIVTKNVGNFTVRFEDDAGSNCANRNFDWVAVALGEFTGTEVPAAPVVSISAIPNPVAALAPFDLNWSSTGATSCTASNGWSGAKATAGTENIPIGILVPTTYTLTCTGPGGSGQNSVLVTIGTAPTVTLDAVPASVGEAGESILTWSSTNTVSCTATDGWSGSKSVSGSESVFPSANTTYTLTCTGPGGAANDSASVTVSALTFVEPTGSPLNIRTNVGPLFDVGGSYQEKGARPAGVTGIGLGADFFVAVKTLCLGIAGCISNWWPYLIPTNSCTLETRRVYGDPTGFGSTLSTLPCDNRLSIPAKAAGWVATGMDRWSHGTDAASAISSCTYTRLVCTGPGISVTQPFSSGILTHPVTAAQTGDGFDFTRTPQCNDGIDNDSPWNFLLDYPLDGDCSSFSDDSE